MVNQPMSSSLRMSDFYPTAEPAEAEETPQRESEKPLQNATKTDISKKELSPNQQVDIEQIKHMLLQNKTEQEMADKLGIHRVTVARKIAAWMQTSDFDEWIDNWWLKLGIELSQDEDTKVEVFKQLTRLKCAKATKKTEVTAQVKTDLDIKTPTTALIQFSRKNTATTDEQK